MSLHDRDIVHPAGNEATTIYVVSGSLVFAAYRKCFDRPTTTQQYVQGFYILFKLCTCCHINILNYMLESKGKSNQKWECRLQTNFCDVVVRKHAMLRWKINRLFNLLCEEIKDIVKTMSTYRCPLQFETNWKLPFFNK